MMKPNSTVWCAALALLSSAGGVGCGDDEDGASEGVMLASSQNAALFRYLDPYAPMMAGMPNPIGNTASAAAEAFDEDGSLRIELAVAGFPPSRTFGSHLHRLACDDPMKAGTHYQNQPFPTGGSATDPVYANNTNEAWLDFITDASGNGEKVLTVDWLPRSGEARAIIFHHMASGVGGVSGAKLACLPLTGF
jgi:superoxide dismutase, Cu-Zn family